MSSRIDLMSIKKDFLTGDKRNIVNERFKDTKGLKRKTSKNKSILANKEFLKVTLRNFKRNKYCLKQLPKNSKVQDKAKKRQFKLRSPVKKDFEKAHSLDKENKLKSPVNLVSLHLIEMMREKKITRKVKNTIAKMQAGLNFFGLYKKNKREKESNSSLNPKQRSSKMFKAIYTGQRQRNFNDFYFHSDKKKQQKNKSTLFLNRNKSKENLNNKAFKEKRYRSKERSDNHKNIKSIKFVINSPKGMSKNNILNTIKGSNEKRKKLKPKDKYISKNNFLRVASIDKEIDSDSHSGKKHISFKPNSIKFTLPRLEDECQFFITSKVSQREDTSMQIEEENISDLSDSDVSIVNDGKELILFDLDKRIKCKRNTEINKGRRDSNILIKGDDYNSYWIECIKSLLGQYKLISHKNVGYYNKIRNEKELSDFLERCKEFKREYKKTNNFEYKTLRAYMLMKKLEFDIENEHQEYFH